MAEVAGMMFLLGLAAHIASAFRREAQRPVPRAIPVRSELKGRYRSW
jgi:hypothetical protein